MSNNQDNVSIAKAIAVLLVGGVLIAGVPAGCMWGMPQYNVYSQTLEGEAELARAESNRQIAVREAQAKLDSAKLTADAEVIRARGVAEANKIIADGLGGPEGYLRWRYIEMLEETSDGDATTIYIPTEAGLPILEAGRGALK